MLSHSGGLLRGLEYHGDELPLTQRSTGFTNVRNTSIHWLHNPGPEQLKESFYIFF